MTGGGRGRCAATTQQICGNNFSGFGGFGGGRGQGNRRDRCFAGRFAGRRRNFSEIKGSVDELEVIKAEAAALEDSLRKINERINQLQQQGDRV
jgi:hypothetical protein